MVILKKQTGNLLQILSYLYKKFRNRVVNEIRSSRVKYYNSCFTKHQSSMKMLWSGIRSIISGNDKKFCNISQIVSSGEIVQNPKEVAQIFKSQLKR